MCFIGSGGTSFQDTVTVCCAEVIETIFRLREQGQVILCSRQTLCVYRYSDTRPDVTSLSVCGRRP